MPHVDYRLKSEIFLCNIGRKMMRENRKLLILFVVCIALLMLSFGGKQQEPQTTYEITVDPDTYTDLSQVSTEGLQYYDSMEEAIKNANPKMLEGYECAREPDTIVKVFESDTEALMFYISYENSRKGVSNIAKFEKRVVNGREQYGFTSMSPSEITKWGIYEKNPKKYVRFSIDASILTNMQGFRIGDGDERFIWGFTQLPEIQNLEIETQKPDEVIKYQEFGNDWYFWYYTDLQSDKTADELNIEFVE